MMRLCLYQPEIPQNTGTLLRTAACFGVGVDIIEPCGFAISDRKLKRSGMDYKEQVNLQFHNNFKNFRLAYPKQRVILLSTKADMLYTDFCFEPDDVLMVGRESDGVPDAIEAQVNNRIIIPMKPACRSLNVAISAAIVLGEANRQLNFFDT